MLEPGQRSDIGRYLPHAAAATLGVVVLPAVVMSTIVRWGPHVPVPVSVLVGVCLGLVFAAVGSSLWGRRPESDHVSFGELMLWTWARRKWAEWRMSRDAEVLGLDHLGRPTRYVSLTREQRLAVLRDLASAIETKDPYTHGHSQRVEQHVRNTALAMGLLDRIDDLCTAAAVHDVGKILVPDRILRKPAGLTLEERLLVEEHVVVGARMVYALDNPTIVAAVKHHHERWDGRGYPDGLSGDQIPLCARLIAVADTYDAMTSTRPYRAAATHERATEVLRAEAGKQLDPEVVGAFLETLALPTAVSGRLVVPVVAGRVVRELAVWLRRAWVASLAPGAAASGAAVLIGSAALGPAIPSRLGSTGPVAAPSKARETVAASLDVSSAASLVTDDVDAAPANVVARRTAVADEPRRLSGDSDEGPAGSASDVGGGDARDANRSAPRIDDGSATSDDAEEGDGAGTPPKGGGRNKPPGQTAPDHNDGDLDDGDLDDADVDEPDLDEPDLDEPDDLEDDDPLEDDKGKAKPGP